MARAPAAFRPVVSHKSNFGGVKCCSILLEDRHDDAIDVAVVLEELELAAVNVGETQGDDDMEVVLQWLLLLLLLLLLLVDDKDDDDDIDEDMDNVVVLLFLFEAQAGRGKSTNSS